MPGSELLYLNAGDLVALNVPPRAVVAALRQAFRAKGVGRVIVPPKLTLQSHSDPFSQVMAAWIEDVPAPVSSALSQAAGAPNEASIPIVGLGTKWVCVFPGNADLGLPTLQGLVVLSDAATGRPLAVLDAAEFTALRTGASVGLAAELLVRPGASTVGLLGCGVQGRASLRSLRAVLPALRRARLFDLRPAAIASLIADLSTELEGVDLVTCREAREVVQGVDVVVTAITMSARKDPPLDSGMVGRGTLAVALDYDAAWTPAAMREFDRFVVDDTPQVLATKAEGHRLAEIPSTIDADLSELATGSATGRSSAEERILCMNLGLALEDVAAGILVYQRALAQGIGSRLAR